MVVALVNTCFVMPLDVVKTHMEKVNPTASYLEAFRKIYTDAGLLGFFTGVRVRVLLGFTNSLFLVSILERLEHM